MVCKSFKIQWSDYDWWSYVKWSTNIPRSTRRYKKIRRRNKRHIRNACNVYDRIICMRFSQPSIYLTTYKGKKYVGQTKGRGNDYYGSGVRIKNIKDKTKLKVKLLETTTLDKLNEREIFWISK